MTAQIIPFPGGEMTLAEQTARRLILAGITWNDPGLIGIREWNHAIYHRTIREE